MDELQTRLLAFFDDARRHARAARVAPCVEHVGRVTSVFDGVATISGLGDCGLDDLVLIGKGVPAIATRLDEQVSCILLGADDSVCAGAEARSTGAPVNVPVGDALLGRVVDALGRPLDGLAAPAFSAFAPAERPAPAIVDRALVSEPLETGILTIDATIPLGRGQRQLIIGDRKTGKTSIALDAMLQQRETDVICVYAAIAQKASSVWDVVGALRAHGAWTRTLVVVGEAGAPPGLAWLTPYAACTMAEYFRDRGKHVLLVLDDLTKHAVVYRELSLLLGSSPGREAFPGDIFYTHSRLLERAAKLSPERSGGSLSALAIAETQNGDLTSYIPTNLVSITDGQVYLDAALFHEGTRPAIHVGKSVSRVGAKAQSKALQSVAATLRLDYAQFAELEVFARFGAARDDRTAKALEHGRRLRAVLAQPRFEPVPRTSAVALLLAHAARLFDDVGIEHMARVRKLVIERTAGLSGSCGFAKDAILQVAEHERELLLEVVRAVLREGQA